MHQFILHIFSMYTIRFSRFMRHAGMVWYHTIFIIFLSREATRGITANDTRWSLFFTPPSEVPIASFLFSEWARICIPWVPDWRWAPFVHHRSCYEWIFWGAVKDNNFGVMKLVKLCSRNNKLFHFALILPPAPALSLSLEKIIIFCPTQRILSSSQPPNNTWNTHTQQQQS